MATQVERALNVKTFGACRYHVEIDVNSDSTHATIIRLAGTNKRVLELGCASGHMSRVLRERGCRVTAIEIDPLAAEHASLFCERMIVGDLDQLDLEEELGGERYDVIIAADVLEHLKDPAGVLRSAKGFARADGCVIVSIPNVAHISVRLALLAGRFPYRETGLLDRTHLRFFTRESVESLFDEAGIAIGHFHRIQSVPADPAGFEVPYDPASVPADVLEALSRDPEASTYQFVIVGYPLPRAELVFIQDRMKRSAYDLEFARGEIANLQSKLEQTKQEHAKETAEIFKCSQQVVNELQVELERARESHAKEIAEASQQSQQSISALQTELEKKTAEGEGLVASLREEIVRVQQETQELSLALEAARSESAALRQIDEEQKNRIEKLEANADALFAREKDLREMLFEAHDQLLRRDEEIASTLATTLPPIHPATPAAALPLPSSSPGKYLSYQLLVQRIRELVRNVAPEGANILVISKGDDDLLRLPPCRGMHFPQAEGGVYAGYYPANSDAAIAHLEKLSKAGAQFLLIPQTALWWLEHYREFGEYLNRNFARVIDEPDICVLFNLAPREERRPEIATPASSAEIPERRPFGVNVSGHITSEKGVGEAVRATIRGLKSAGISVALNDFRDGSSVNLETEFTDFTEENPFALNLIHFNAESLPGYSIPCKTAPYLRGHYNIGYWFWETAAFPPEWWDRFEYLDEVWVGTDFVLDSVSRVSPIPVVKIPMALPDRLLLRPRSRADFGIPADAFMLVFVFDYMSIAQRKNPLGAIEAFRKAFRKRDKAILVLKSGHSSAYPDQAKQVARACEGANIKIIDEVLPREDVNSLMHLGDCYVSLHRSEGFGLTLAEAMSLGKPVIATAYSGNMDFTNPANSYLVKYKLVEIGSGCDPYRDGVWADPDIDHAAELMRHVFKNRAEAREIGRTARMHVLETLNSHRSGAMMRDRILRIAGLGKIEAPSAVLESTPQPNSPPDQFYIKLIGRIADVVNQKVPSEARVLVVSKGDDELLKFSGRTGWHFPQAAKGVYAGHHPAGSAEAIGQLEMLRRKGGTYLLFPRTAFWWLDHYAEFRSYLEASYGRIWNDEDCIIYALLEQNKGTMSRLRDRVAALARG